MECSVSLAWTFGLSTSETPSNPPRTLRKSLDLRGRGTCTTPSPPPI
ncbi:hypothetical protein VTJ83DRAFT_1489 [Remersonia thermophila]|uniref:Uncharacterized protein n=1 Tax=Remersonia thermophila TaxID=72144 RepID=A0ABR4DG50_9PEZI